MWKVELIYHAEQSMVIRIKQKSGRLHLVNMYYIKNARMNIRTTPCVFHIVCD